MSETGRTSRLFPVWTLAAAAGTSYAVWKAADHFKAGLLGDMYAGIKPWVLQFYHPYAGGLINYLALCAVLGAAALVVYAFMPRACGALKAGLEPGDDGSFSGFWGAGLLALGGAAFVLCLMGPLRLAVILAAILAARRLPYRAGPGLYRAALAALLALVAVEPVRVALGPARLMNEYREIYGETLVAGRYVRNDLFPGAVRQIAAEAAGPGASAQDAALLARRLWMDFGRANLLEYWHQVMGRGQVNHFGYILNPVNEYELGRPLKEIYMQYGAGNTLLFKWAMGLFGGTSVENYYKCYAFYLLYYAVFLGALLYVFRDPAYALCGFAAASFKYFSYGYSGFLLAPGIIPTIHLFDAALLAALAAWLRGGRAAALWAAALLGAAAVLVNRPFGAALAFAGAVTFAVHALENGGGRRRLLQAALPAAAAALALWLGAPAGGGGGEGMLVTYFSGLFSWTPGRIPVAFTLLYLPLSYLFLFVIRGDRSAEKYLYLFCFVYAQGLFGYFYWSGLTNHFPAALPFTALQGLFALAWGIKRFSAGPPEKLALLENFKGSAALFMTLAALASAFLFYRDEPISFRGFRDNFRQHRVHQWDFPRARVLSTMPPGPFAGAAALIRKYSPAGGIYIISKYDNILPLLSGRYSLMPYPEMPWHLMSDKAAERAGALLEERAPEYLFVDTDIAGPPPGPWEIVYSAEFFGAEAEARRGRLAELAGLFGRVSGAYSLAEAGPLISVYRRRP